MRKGNACIFGLIVLIFLIGGCIPVQNIIISGPAVGMEIERYPADVLGNEDKFNVVVKLSNSLPREVNGELCVEDSVSDALGGIKKDCRSVVLEKTQSGSELIETVEDSFVFPSEEGFYSYRGLGPIHHEGNIISTFKFGVNSYASAEICVKRYGSAEKCTDKEIIKSIQQENLPIEVESVEKSASAFGNLARINFRILLKKKEKGEIIDMHNFESGAFPVIGFSGEFAGRSIKCSDAAGGGIEFLGDEKLIKCETSLNLNQDYMDGKLVMNLKYGFKKVDSSPSYQLKEESAEAYY